MNDCLYLVMSESFDGGYQMAMAAAPVLHSMAQLHCGFLPLLLALSPLG
jgi:hypothetical protein